MSTEFNRAYAWFQQLNDQRPEWDDVEVAVRLGVRSAAVVGQLLWRDRAALETVWPAFMAAVYPPTLDPATQPAADLPLHVSATEDLAQQAGEKRRPPLVAARLEALLAWRDRARAAGEFSADLDRELLTIAEAKKPDWKGLPGLLRDRSDELRALLASVVIPATVDETPPAAVEAPSASPPSDAPTTGSVGAPVEIDPDDFAEFAFLQTVPGARPEPRDLDFTVGDDGALTYKWPEAPVDGRFRIFRVFTNDEYAPPAPVGSRVVVTTGTFAIDVRPFAKAVRHVAVWVNEGADESSAQAAQPWLYAKKECVLPVRNFLTQTDEGTVYGQWDAPDDIDRVDVLRIPLEDVERVGEYAPDYKISSESLSGFVDATAQPGRDYVYRIFTRTTDGLLSVPVSRTVSLDAVAPRIDDLTVHRRDDGTCDVEWAHPDLPGTKVEIYRAQSAPSSGIADRVFDRTALTLYGLTSDLKALPPIEIVEGRGWMRGVPWPKAWPRAYFTAVTVVDETRIQVGATRVVHRPTEVADVAIVERVDEQLVTFVWPEGVPSIKIYQGHIGSPLVDPELQMDIAEISQEQYDRFGAVHLADTLPPKGCDVHVVAVSYAAAKPSYSRPATATYAGLTRISYKVELEEVPEPAGGGLFKRRPTPSKKRRIRVRSEVDIERIDLRLVHNAGRLPLHADDGSIIGRRSLSLSAGSPAVLVEGIDFAGQVGFVRLFAELPSDIEAVTAILDPSISSLRCDR